MSKKRKKSRRESEQYPALKPKYNLKTRTDLIDYDYIDKLSDEEKEWLNKFTEEYINANVKKKDALHKTKKQRKDCYDRNNARNRCILTKAKAAGKADSLDDAIEIIDENLEDRLIEELDEFRDSNDQSSDN